MDSVRLYIQDASLRRRMKDKFGEKVKYSSNISSASVSIVEDYESWLKGVKANSFPILTKRFKGRKQALAEVIIKSLYFPSLIGVGIFELRNFISPLNRGRKPHFLYLKEFRTSSLKSSIMEIIEGDDFLKFKKENQDRIRAIFVRADIGRKDSLREAFDIFEHFSLIAVDNPEITVLSTSPAEKEKPRVRVMYYF